MLKNDPFPQLETKRLILRKISPADAQDIFAMRADERMHLFTDTLPDETTHQTAAYIEKMNSGVEANRSIIWAMQHRQAQKVIGTISLWDFQIENASAELGYGIIPEYQGQGLMKEALLQVCAYGLGTLGLRQLFAYTEENNQASIRLLETCNFRLVDRVVDEGVKQKRSFQMMVYVLESLSA